MTRNTSDVAVCCSSDSVSSPGARLHLIEQTCVFDRNHRLVGKGSHQLNLLVSERIDYRSGQHQDADRRRPPRVRGTAKNGAHPSNPTTPSTRGPLRVHQNRLDIRECVRPSNNARPAMLPRSSFNGWLVKISW